MLDLMVGDPHSIPHPIVWIGKLIAWLDAVLLGEIPAEKRDPETRNKASEHRKLSNRYSHAICLLRQVLEERA